MEDLVIKNGLVVTARGTVRGGLAGRNERILQIGADDSSAIERWRSLYCCNY